MHSLTLLLINFFNVLLVSCSPLKLNNLFAKPSHICSTKLVFRRIYYENLYILGNLIRIYIITIIALYLEMLVSGTTNKSFLLQCFSVTARKKQERLRRQRKPSLDPIPCSTEMFSRGILVLTTSCARGGY